MVYDVPFDGSDIEAAKIGFLGRLDKYTGHQSYEIVRVDFDV
jgi:hypothetical protein